MSSAVEVVDGCVQYCAFRTLTANLIAQVMALQETANIPLVAIHTTIRATSDGIAQVGVSSADSARTFQQTTCEVFLKVHVGLTGLPEAKLRRIVDGLREAFPVPPVFEVALEPAALLSQRPDSDSARCSLAAGSAEVGQNKANCNPSLPSGRRIPISATSRSSPVTGWTRGRRLSFHRSTGVRIALASVGRRQPKTWPAGPFIARFAQQLKELRTSKCSFIALPLASPEPRGWPRGTTVTGYPQKQKGVPRVARSSARPRHGERLLPTIPFLARLLRSKPRQHVALYMAFGRDWESDALPSATNPGVHP